MTLMKICSRYSKMDKKFEKTVTQLKKMAIAKGVRPKVANKMSKTGLVDVLGK